jgi:hypothetical protein
LVRGDQLLRRERLDRGEEALEQRRIVEVGRRRAELAVHLRERRAAEAVLAASEVDEQQIARAVVAVRPQLGRQRAPDVGHRRHRGHHE